MKATRNRALLGAVIAMCILGAPAYGRAAEAYPPPFPSEAPRGVAQYLAGAGVAVVGLGLSLVAAERSDGGFLAVLALTPAAVGQTVCSVGRGSSHYEGSCVGPIVSGYLGLLAMVPGAMIGSRVLTEPSRRNEQTEVGDHMIGAAAGYVLVAPLLATAIWHLNKRPRAATGAHLVPPGTAFTAVHPRLRVSMTEARRPLLAPRAVGMPLMSLVF